MHARNSIFTIFSVLGLVNVAGILSLAGCGMAPADTAEGQAALLAWPVPVALRLTSIKMNGRSNNLSTPVNVYVTLPGLASTRSYIGDYAPKGPVGNIGFNCGLLGAVLGSDGYCTAKLPLRTSMGATKFTGKYPANSNSAPASVRINDTVTNFTIDSQGHASQTCASAWMMLGNQNDGDKVTVCWQVAVATPFISPPLLETIFYLAPGEESSVGLEHSNSISTTTSYSYENGSGHSFNLDFDIVGVNVTGGLTISESRTVGAGQTITSGSSSGFSVRSTSMLPDPDNNLYEIVLGAHASWMDFHDGSAPSMVTDISSGAAKHLTAGQLKGLLKTPQDLSGIAVGDRGIIKQYLTPQFAGQLLAKDPFFSGQPLAQTVMNNSQRFIPAVPSEMTMQRRPCDGCGDIITENTQVHGSGTDQTVGQTTGSTVTTSVLGVSGTDVQTMTVTYSDTNQSTAKVTLTTHSRCVEGRVKLYMDKAFGTVVSVPELRDSCNAPSNLCEDGSTRPHVLLPGQSLVTGQSLTSCPPSPGVPPAWSLTLQPDGMLVERYLPDGSAATSFWTPGATRATMEANGNFVVRDANGSVLTESGTASGAGAYLILQDDGYIKIYNPLGNSVDGTGGALPALWSMAPGG